jgi:hypothetical protein
LPVFTSFFHRPGKNTICHGKKPTLIAAEPQSVGAIEEMLTAHVLSLQPENLNS